jgi:hypothetical protein
MNIATYLVAFVAVFGFGGLLFDAMVPITAKQHLWNPNWPPHAKLHNCQSMLLGIINGSLTLILLFGIRPLTLPIFFAATSLSSAYFVAMLLAPLFPGTAWTDPEFVAATPRPLGLHPQQLVSYVLLALLVIAAVIALTQG